MYLSKTSFEWYTETNTCLISGIIDVWVKRKLEILTYFVMYCEWQKLKRVA